MDNKNSANRFPMDSADLASVIIGIGFLFLVGFIFWFTLRTMNTTDGFSQYGARSAPLLASS
jgi:hypothetical protein